MSLAQSEETRRRAVRGFLERMEPDTRSLNREDLWSRQELFGYEANSSDRSFQARCLTRMCALRVLDSMLVRQGSTQSRLYVLRDSTKVLDALTDDEALTQLIWKRPGMDLFDKTPAEESVLDSFVPDSAPTLSKEDRGTATALAGVASASGLPEMTLKLLAGLVETLYYVRVKVEGIEKKLEQLERGIHTLNSQFEVVALESATSPTSNGVKSH